MAKTTNDNFTNKNYNTKVFAKSIKTSEDKQNAFNTYMDAIKDFDKTIKQTKENIQNIKQTNEELTKIQKQDIEKYKKILRNEKEKRDAFRKQKEKILDDYYKNNTIIGKTESVARTINDNINPDVKKDLTNIGVLGAFGVPGMVLQQLGAGKLVKKGAGALLHYGRNKILGSLLRDHSTTNTADSPMAAQTSDDGSTGAGFWNKKEKAQEPVVRIKNNTEEILKILKKDKTPKNQKKEKEKNGFNFNFGSGWLGALKNFLGRKLLQGIGWLGKKILLPALIAGGLYKLFKYLLPEELEDHAGGAVIGAEVAGMKLKNPGNLTKVASEARLNHLNKMAKTAKGAKLGAIKAEAQSITKSLKGGRVSGASSAGRIAKTAGGLSKAMKWAGPVGLIVGAGLDAYQSYDEYKEAAARGDQVGKEKAVAGGVGRLAGGTGGALLGAKGGAAAGAAIGAMFGGVGAVPGALIGGLIGSIGGGIAGSWAGDKLGRGGVDAYHYLADEQDNSAANNYTTVQNPVPEMNSFQIEQNNLLQSINNSLIELNNSLSPEMQRFLDEQYMKDLDQLRPAPKPDVYFDPYNNFDGNAINPFVNNNTNA